MAVARTSPSAVHDLPATRLAILDEPLRLYRGGVVEHPIIAYETWGRLNEARDNTILLFTGLSPSAHAASSPADPKPGWWEPMIGEGKAIDTRRFFVVCVNSLGSPFGSSGPVSIDPRTGRPYGIQFPEIAVEDIARGGFEVLRELGIWSVQCVIGPSLGGCTVLAFAVQFPEITRNMITISGAAAASPFAIALRSLQRELVRSDPAWRGGHYESGRGPRQGLRLARKLGTITYRGHEEWDQRFGRRRIAEATGLQGDFRPQFEVEAYLEHQGQRFADRFDANSYLYLSRASDQFDLAEHGRGSLAAAFAKFKLERTLVLGVQSDMLYTIDQQQLLAEQLRAAGGDVEFHAFPSPQGHDAFLVDYARFEPAIGNFLKKVTSDQ
ncbi:MAG TPA: homoserine O-acetyltransferase [Steroidobacteraceae bacterium]|nr:homoserine O-acetyltransferase [Steroidobacteraceae bacterium]